MADDQFSGSIWHRVGRIAAIAGAVIVIRVPLFTAVSQSSCQILFCAMHLLAPLSRTVLLYPVHLFL